MTDSKYPMCEKLGLNVIQNTIKHMGNAGSTFDAVNASDLEKLLSQAVRVYSRNPLGGIWDAIPLDNSTHSALLIGIEELPKEKCKHEPMLAPASHYFINRCKHCSARLTPTGWKAAGE